MVFNVLMIKLKLIGMYCSFYILATQKLLNYAGYLRIFTAFSDI